MGAMEALRAFIMAHPILATSLSSLWGAIIIDLIAFAKAKDPGDFFGQFSFKVALWKYAQALVSGFVGNAVVAGAAATVALVIYLW